MIYTFTHQALFAAVCDIDTLTQAWVDVWGKRTAAARRQGAGVDGVTVADWAANWQDQLLLLQADLRDGTYRPQPLHRFKIARAGGGTRQLGIPTVRDRVAQRAVKNVIEPLLEPVFLSCSHGFRPARSVFTAIVHVLWHERQGRRWVVDADIESYFDTLRHDRLLAQVDGLGDARLTTLVGSWLAVGEASPGRGVAQGAVISPLLSNLYLHPFDVAMIDAGWALVRYADDLVVMCATPEEAQVALAEIGAALATLDLALNPDKTAIRPLGPDFGFLGAQFVRE